MLKSRQVLNTTSPKVPVNEELRLGKPVWQIESGSEDRN
jgi:hypothetical protein